MDDLDAAEAAIMQLIPYLVAIIDARRSTPGDDLLSGLLAVEDEGDTLSPAELIAFVVLLYVAGHETTVNLIGNGTLALLRNPDELMRWRNDPSLDGAAVDELLRFDGPVQHTVRVPMEPVTFTGAHGETIVAEPGDTVLTVLGAANHDPAMFDDPHALRLDRHNAHRHLAFSAGIHYCLGASLAKLEATIAIGRLIRRFDSIELAGEPHWRDRLTIRGVDRLPLRRVVARLRVLQQVHERARVPALPAALDDLLVELVDERRQREAGVEPLGLVEADRRGPCASTRPRTRSRTRPPPSCAPGSPSASCRPRPC